MPLNTIEFSRLSIEGLGYLLSCTLEKEEHFATPEYEVFRYSAILVAKQVSDNELKFWQNLRTIRVSDVYQHKALSNNSDP